MTIDPDYGYFLPSETRSKDGAPGDIRDELRAQLNAMRKDYGKPIQITSGYRSQEYNKKVRGAPNSFHTKGLAADILLPHDPADREQLLRSSFKFHWNGRGFYKTFIHLDMRQLQNYDPAYWVG
jgi:zinc D-Ala-D-Ala carboxypeptidase